ncbi:MAG: hypothetical protein LVQ97_05040 [Candidatus Micrarchaeales archaeon]|jgi:hypothetical protein|uniref:Uncharacterized protein n=1 Tax=Candidatus Micrarchaeum acidiphilum ARMAN-2 TaxID=425595 RepID=C7DGS7_MICA2|nr:MAG: hypothetical protein UNLARM2_0277 [Candidatus Micrarchaeum acidiphilum ARMAN-2]MCW6161524.1 hypothetical protein [Candidatus Micrarchaeales archaeon]
MHSNIKKPAVQGRTAYSNLAVAVCYVIFALFLLYFVVLNNSYFILYSFVLFVALGVMLSIYEKFTDLSIGIAIAIIVGSSVAYFSTATAIAVYSFAALAFYAAFLLFTDVRDSRINLTIAIAAFLPAGLYSAGIAGSGPLVINVAILGYYLLISVVLGIFLSMVYSESRLEKAALRLKAWIKRSSAGISICLIIIGVALLFGPVWPTGTHYNLAATPHAAIGLKVPSGAFNSTYVSLNLTPYRYLLNGNFSNMRFYAGAAAINASVVGVPVSVKNVTVLLYANSSRLRSENGRIMIYFFPYNSSFGKSLAAGYNVSHLNRSAASEPVSYENITGMYSLVNKTIRQLKPVLMFRNTSKSEKIYPYFSFSQECVPGFGASARFNITSNATFSMFLLKNLSDLSKAELTNASGPSYDYYIKSFERYSYRKYVNVTKVSSSVQDTPQCVSLVLLPKNESVVKISVLMSYYVNETTNLTISVPSMFSNATRYRSAFYGFLPSSLEYLSRLYYNETAQGNRSAG